MRLLLLLALACSPAEPLPARAIGAGSGGLTCAVQPSGEAVCWGIEDCDLPIPDACESNPSLCPGADDVLPPEDTVLIDVSVGASHACARDERGRLRCWGSPLGGQTLAPGGVWDASKQPEVFAMLKTFERGVEGGGESCAFLEDYWNGVPREKLLHLYVLAGSPREVNISYKIRKRFPRNDQDDKAIEADRKASARAQERYDKALESATNQKRKQVIKDLQVDGIEFSEDEHSHPLLLSPDEMPRPVETDKWALAVEDVCKMMNSDVLDRFYDYLETIAPKGDT